MLLPPPSRIRTRGYTFLEMMVIVAVIGIVGSIALSATASAYERSLNQKLRGDVRTLNSAVKIYLANGGDLTSATDTQDVLKRLKTSLSEENAAKFVGLTSSMVDVRIEAEYQTAAEAVTDQYRAEWDPSKGRFVIGNTGDRGVKRFYFNEDLAGTEFENELRHHNGFTYALEDDWIWDYEERPKLTPTPVTTVNIYFKDRGDTGVIPSTNPTGEPDPEPDPDPEMEPDPDAPTPLDTPVFDPEGGIYNYDEFPMDVTIIDTNEPGEAILRYSVNHSSFRRYYEGTTITVDEDDTIYAYAVATDPETHLDSALANAFYESTPFTFGGTVGGEFREGKNNNGHGNNLDRADVSNPGQAPFEDESGDVDDEANTAVVSYEKSGSNAKVYMGTSRGNKANVLNFFGTEFESIEPEELFDVGNVVYDNNSIKAGTEVTDLKLNMNVGITSANPEILPIQIGFLNPGNSWNYQGNMGNGHATNNANNWENAATVYIRYRTVPLAQQINGKNYFLVLKMGQSGGDGLASDGTLTVLRDRTASVPIYGYFTETAPE